VRRAPRGIEHTRRILDAIAPEPRAEEPRFGELFSSNLERTSALGISADPPPLPLPPPPLPPVDTDAHRARLTLLLTGAGVGTPKART
jgi:hypothetical protein